MTTATRYLLGWNNLKDLLIDKSIEAGNCETGLIVLSDGSIVDLSMNSLLPALARQPMIVPYGVPLPTSKITAVMSNTYQIRSGEGGDATELRVAVYNQLSRSHVSYVLLKLWTSPNRMTGVSEFLLANHIKYTPGGDLIKGAEEDTGELFQW